MAWSPSKIQKLEAKGKNGRLLMGDWIEYWLDEDNGYIGKEYPEKDKHTKKETGRILKTTSFHSVTSGFNETTRAYYGEKCDPKEFIEEAKKRKLISTDWQRGGVKGLRIKRYTENTSRSESILTSMGLTPKNI